MNPVQSAAYRPEIDGLRAIAVLPVIFFHAGIYGFGGGYVGVDVFFVISGFLITNLLIADIEAGELSLLDFYERRARRILPALFFVMICSVPIGWIVLTPDYQSELVSSISAAATFTANFFFLTHSGYFDTAAELQPMLHTWSLAVEEQFYIFFPLILIGLTAISVRQVSWTLGALALMSFCLAVYLVEHDPPMAFYLLPTRTWELLVGAIAAILMRRGLFETSKLTADLGSMFGLFMIAIAVISFDHQTTIPGIPTLLPVFGTALVLSFATKGTLVARLLSLPPIVGVGLISYSAYLWHNPLLVFLRHQRFFEPEFVHRGAAIALSLILAWLTWRLVESPFRDRSRTSKRNLVLTLLPIWLALVALGNWFGGSSETLKLLWLHSQNNKTQNMVELLDHSDPSKQHWGALSDGTFDGDQTLSECRFNKRDLTESIAMQFLACAEQHGPGTLVLGDSHAIDLFGSVASRFDAPFVVGLTKGSCRAYEMDQNCPYTSVSRFVAQNPNVFRSVIFEQSGIYLLKTKGGEPVTHRLYWDLPPDARVPALVPELHRIEKSLEFIKELLPHTSITWFGSRAGVHFLPASVHRMGCAHAFDYRPGQVDGYKQLDEIIANLSGRLDGLRYVSQIETYDLDLSEDFMSCDTAFWSDGDHYSAEGEKRFGNRLPADFLEAVTP